MPDVHLVTDDDEVEERVRTMFEALPDVSAYKGKKVVRRSSIDAERRLLEAGCTAGKPPPELIILDGAVRRSGSEPVQTDGGPAASFLQELRERQQRVPVLVLSQGSLEKLENEVLQRWDVAMWKPPPPSSLDDLAAGQSQFVDVLEGLDANAGKRKRDITITVGPRLAKYRVVDGHYTFELERFYTIGDQPGMLIRQAKRFAPFVKGVLDPKWQEELSDAGRELYRLIVEDVFGRQLLETVKAAGHGVDFRFHVELNDVTGHGEVDDLFLLPFEAVNSDLQPENFFCARVPMARRVRKSSGRRTVPVPNAERRKILLVIGAEGGVSTIRNEQTGEPQQVQLGLLAQAEEVGGYLVRLCAAAADGQVIELDRLDAREAVGRTFQRALMERLTRTEYDVVHFYGHSVAIPGGGTFLIAPGEDDYTGYPISIRAVASWIKDLGGKPRLPSLVLLSSCQSGSVQTAVEMMNAGVENVIGFRWEVEETTAADYVMAFYDAYVGRRDPVSESYRYACDQARVLSQGTPGWASAILIND